MDSRYVQYGSGWSAPVGWRNFDASPTLRFERLPIVGRLYTKNDHRFPSNTEPGDIVKGLPLPDGSCDVVYCSHVLEHLSLSDFRIALRNTLRLLRPGARFRMVLPDLEYLARQYLEDPGAGAAEKFMRASYLGKERRARGAAAVVQAVVGHSAHMWMWDYKSLAGELEKAGFTRVRRAYFGDSGDEKLAVVEDKERWENALGAEAWRPD